MKVTSTAEWVDARKEKPTITGSYKVFGYHGGTDFHTQFSYHYDVGEDFWHDGECENLTDTEVWYWLRMIDPYSDPVNLQIK